MGAHCWFIGGYLIWWKGGGSSLKSVFLKALILFLKALPSWPNHLPEAPFLIPSFGAVDFSTWIFGNHRYPVSGTVSQTFLSSLVLSFFGLWDTKLSISYISLLLLLWLCLISRASSRRMEREKKAVGVYPTFLGSQLHHSERKVSLPYSADFFSCHCGLPITTTGDCLISGVQETREKRKPQGFPHFFWALGVAFHLHEKD